MSDFHKEAKHENHFCVIFDSFNVEHKIKPSLGDLKCVIAKDKEEKRLSGMLQSAGEIGANFVALQSAALTAVGVASTVQDAMLQQLGWHKLTPNGFILCPACLDKAILACEENLEVLKDIREATKQYATNH